MLFQRKALFAANFFILFFGFSFFAQNSKIDSLKKVINTAPQDTNKIKTLFKICNEFKMAGNFDSLLVYANIELKLSQKLSHNAGIADAYNFISIVHRSTGDYKTSLEFILKALKIKEDIGDKKGIASCYNNMANLYYLQEKNKEAMLYHQKALKLREEIGDKVGMATSYNNVGMLYNEAKDYDKGLESYDKAVKLFESMGDMNRAADCYNGIGMIYKKKADYYWYHPNEVLMNKFYNMAIEAHKKALKIKLETGDKKGIATTYGSLGNALVSADRYDEAYPHLLNALEMYKQMGYKDGMKTAYNILSESYGVQKKYKEAYEYHVLYSKIKDTLFNETNLKQMNELNTKYETEKKDKELVLKEAEITKKDAESVKQQAQRNVFIVGFGLVLLLAIFIFRGYRQKQKDNLVITKQKEEVEKQKHIIEEQKEIVEEKQKEVVDSITYAKRLQNAILPSSTNIKTNFPASFLLYMPKDIVAGDFYWMEKTGDTILIAAADSTGHGVPGAMVSVVCSNALNRAVLEFHITEPGKILDKARELVIQTFDKSGEEVKDGMDISLAAINLKTRKVKWAGAHNPLWYQTGKEMIDLSANKQPIGRSEHYVPFTTHEIELNKGDSLYLFTDGYADQFGGPKGKKFKYAPLKDLLIKTSALEPEAQKSELIKQFEDWKGNLEQVDDVCIIGIRV